MFHRHIRSSWFLKIKSSGNLWCFRHHKLKLSKIKFAIWMFKLKTVCSQNGCVHNDIIHCGIITLFRGNWATICFMMNPRFKIPANAFLVRLATGSSIIIPVSSTFPSDSHNKPRFFPRLITPAEEKWKRRMSETEIMWLCHIAVSRVTDCSTFRGPHCDFTPLTRLQYRENVLHLKWLRF